MATGRIFWLPHVKQEIMDTTEIFGRTTYDNLKQTVAHWQVLKAYRLSEWIFLFILKVANIRCFILIKYSEQEVRFKKRCYNVVISEKNSNVCW